MMQSTTIITSGWVAILEVIQIYRKSLNDCLSKFNIQNHIKMLYLAVNDYISENYDLHYVFKGVGGGGGGGWMVVVMVVS